jgi:hypothetical protein
MATNLYESDRKEASESASKSGEKFDQLQREIVRDRAAFFEKLALLNGSALVLSISLLSYIASRPNAVIKFPLVLHVGWGFLLLGLLASVFRNLFHQHYHYHQVYSWYARDIADLKQAELRMVQQGGIIIVDAESRPVNSVEFAASLEMKHKTWSSRSKKAEGIANRFENIFIVAEWVAQLSFCSGVILMVFFSVANIP